MFRMAPLHPKALGGVGGGWPPSTNSIKLAAVATTKPYWISLSLLAEKR